MGHTEALVSTSRTRIIAILALAATTLLWAFPPIAIRYLSADFDGFTQNMYRYGISAIFLLALSAARRRNIFRMRGRDFLQLLGPAIPNLAYQIIWVAALYRVYPGFAAVLNRMWVVFSILLAAAIFPDEREAVKQWKFILGTIMSLFGVVGVLYFKQGNFAVRFDESVFLIVVGAAAWAMYAIQIKRAVTRIDPSDAFLVVSLYTAVPLIALGFMFGAPMKVFEVDSFVNVVLFGSGIGCIALGHTMYYIAIKELGVSICSTFVLLSCLLTVVLSHFIFGEIMTAGQIVSGVVLITGAVLAIWCTCAPTSPGQR